MINQQEMSDQSTGQLEYQDMLSQEDPNISYFNSNNYPYDQFHLLVQNQYNNYQNQNQTMCHTLGSFDIDQSQQIQAMSDGNSRNQNTEMSSKNQHWTEQEKQLYTKFLMENIEIATSNDKNLRKQSKFFVNMSRYIGTRNDTQCKSHHQKQVQKGYLEKLKKQITTNKNDEKFLTQFCQQNQQQNNQDLEQNLPPFYSFNQPLNISLEFNQNIFAENQFQLHNSQFSNPKSKEKKNKPQSEDQNENQSEVKNYTFLQMITQLTNGLKNCQQKAFHYYDQLRQITENLNFPYLSQFLNEEEIQLICQNLSEMEYGSPYNHMQVEQANQDFESQNLTETIRPFQSSCSNHEQMSTSQIAQSTCSNKKKPLIKKRISKKKF